MGDCNVLVGPPKYIAGAINWNDHDNCLIPAKQYVVIKNDYGRF